MSMRVDMARRAQLSAGENIAKTWNAPAAWRRKQSSVTATAEGTETLSHCAQLPATQPWLTQIHL